MRRAPFTPQRWPVSTRRPGGVFVAPRTPPLPEPHPVWRATRLNLSDDLSADLADLTWIPSAGAIEAQAASMR
jgi:hypothetical protein